MTVDVFWDDEAQTRLIFVVDKTWSIEEFLNGLSLIDMLVLDGRRVDLLVDVSTADFPPSRIFPYLRRGLQHPRINNYIFVGMPRAGELIMQNVKRLSMGRIRDFHFTDSIESARQLLHSETVLW